MIQPTEFQRFSEYAPRQLAVTDEKAFVNSAQSSLYQLVPSDFILHRIVIFAKRWDLNWWDSRGGSKIVLLFRTRKKKKSMEPFPGLMKKSCLSVFRRKKDYSRYSILIAAHTFLRGLILLEPDKPLWSAPAPPKCEAQQPGPGTMKPPVLSRIFYRGLINLSRKRVCVVCLTGLAGVDIGFAVCLWLHARAYPQLCALHRWHLRQWTIKSGCMELWQNQPKLYWGDGGNKHPSTS